MTGHASLTTGLLSYWSFLDDLTDDVGSNDLTGFNTPTYSADYANLGAGIVFNGTNQYAAISPPTSLAPTTTLSVAIWLKTTGAVTSNQQVMDRGGGGEGVIFRLRSPGDVQFAFNGGVASVDSVGTIDDTNPHLIVLTYDRNAGGTDEGKLYIDNSQDGSMNYSTLIDYAPDPNLFIGATSGAAEYAAITLYALGIWSKVLTAQEMTDYYNSANGLSYA